MKFLYLSFLQFYCKISRNQLEIAVEATYTLILMLWNTEIKILRKKPGKRFGFHSKDFQVWKNGVVTPIWYHVSMITLYYYKK